MLAAEETQGCTEVFVSELVRVHARPRDRISPLFNDACVFAPVRITFYAVGSVNGRCFTVCSSI